MRQGRDAELTPIASRNLLNQSQKYLRDKSKLCAINRIAVSGELTILIDFRVFATSDLSRPIEVTKKLPPRDLKLAMIYRWLLAQ